MAQFAYTDIFADRHCGTRVEESKEMLEAIGVSSIDELIEQTIPKDIRLPKALAIGEAISEYEFLNYCQKLADKNDIAKSYIGMGYYPTITPAVIRRNVLENPGWYTQYTPYQAEISQGRLEALMNFQTMISDLTGLPIANASLLDEGTAAAEAMIMFHSQTKTASKNGNKFFVSSSVFPQTVAVLKTRSLPFGIEIEIGDWASFKPSKEYFGCLIQYPDGNGVIHNYESFVDECKKQQIFVAVCADIMALTLLRAPGEFGADVCVGSSQRFGVPMGFGGPHAAFFACKDDFKRIMPGRIIGASIDNNGHLAYRMALQVREQHIKRERATSNICTAQVLLAVMASMYAVYHGPNGITKIAKRIHQLAQVLDKSLTKVGFDQVNEKYFDTIMIKTSADLTSKIKTLAEAKFINFRYLEEGTISIAIGESASIEDIQEIVSLFAEAIGYKQNVSQVIATVASQKAEGNFGVLDRKSVFLSHKNFNSYHTETELMRYLKRLENKDLSLTSSMIALGSCTMKLNAAAEMYGISMPGFAAIHPFAPASQTKGYAELTSTLSAFLAEITGLPGVSLQPNSGAQGEYTGLMVIREYLKATGQSKRNVILIPASAHGTNPASAVMAGMKVVVVNCDSNGNIDIDDLKKKATQNQENLAGLMVTYPSTHGVFESRIREMCSLIHDTGGLVYMDGANMNAQVGLTQPAMIGADVCHLNLHKTFAIPHGGGGPGMGPICVSEKLKPYLPGHPVVSLGASTAMTPVSSAPYGSASILVISLGYIMMLGGEGLKKATEVAILNANYLKAKLEPHYKVLYSGEKGRVGHELIFDFHDFKKTAGIEVEDVSKRLMDYGYHAPTVSFPVHGTLMIEPTESESKAELDRFIDALIAIRQEIAEIETGKADLTDNVLKNAPHTAQIICSDEWNHGYSRQKGAYPLPYLLATKFWPSVSRVNNAFGDRNLICSCNSIADYIAEIE